MATPFTLKNLRDVEDSAQKFGIGHDPSEISKPSEGPLLHLHSPHSY